MNKVNQGRINELDKMKSMQILVESVINKSQMKNKNRLDKSRRDVNFKIGDLVLLKRPSIDKGSTKKLNNIYNEFWKILQ